ncbi:MAG: 5-bromo-4-chloroindolyl phosphate hydrolysis family protein [Treponema sp.]|nr:5-bromo-4-chloroindolyl phosphate hydrolysis family protein [Treponema sp.]
MDERDIFKYGEEILHSINKAAETGNFSSLSNDIRRSVSGAATSLTSSLSSGIRNGVESGLRNAFSPRNEQRTPFFAVKVNKHSSNISGMIKIVIGSLIDFITGILILGSIVSISDGTSSLKTDLGPLIFVGLIFAGGTSLILSGKKKRALVKDYFHFGNIIGNRAYSTVKELADRTGRAPEYIVRQIKKMKQQGWLPYAALDRGETTLMLTDDVYKEYLKSTAYMQDTAAATKTEEEAHRKQDTGEDKEPEKVDYYTIDPKLPKEVQDILKEGIEYLHKIRYFNDLIPDTETMSDKLYTLEATALSIFKKLRETPDIAGNLRKFMSYYLPTTEKLLQSYVDLRKQSLNVQNIANAQKEIEEATDVINDAFVKLLNQLFESTSWDIASDISVMKTMMKQDALL